MLRATTTSEQLLLLPVEAKLRARRGSLSDARELAEQAVRIADDTDGLNVIASTRLALAVVRRLEGLDDEAEAANRDAIALFERKGNDAARRTLVAFSAPAGTYMTRGPRCGPLVA